MPKMLQHTPEFKDRCVWGWCSRGSARPSRVERLSPGGELQASHRDHRAEVGTAPMVGVPSAEASSPRLPGKFRTKRMFVAGELGNPAGPLEVLETDRRRMHRDMICKMNSSVR